MFNYRLNNLRSCFSESKITILNTTKIIAVIVTSPTTGAINLYKNKQEEGADKLIPLVNCSINLFRSPVIQVDFGHNQGSVIISQLVTEGRLSRRNIGTDLYSKRYDPVAVQFVLNLLNEVVKN